LLFIFYITYCAQTTLHVQFDISAIYEYTFKLLDLLHENKGNAIFLKRNHQISHTTVEVIWIIMQCSSITYLIFQKLPHWWLFWCIMGCNASWKKKHYLLWSFEWKTLKSCLFIPLVLHHMGLSCMCKIYSRTVWWCVYN